MHFKDYTVEVVTVYASGNTTKARMMKSKLLEIIRDGHLVRVKDWVESESDRRPSWVNPFRIAKIRFDKVTGDLTYLQLKQADGPSK